MQRLNAPVVGLASTPDGRGYWVVACDGGVFAFGDARFDGSMGGATLDQPVVGIAADPVTGGYWEVAKDGGIFAFGAPFEGSPADLGLVAPVVGITAAPFGQGYWVVAADGGVFSFGSADFHGSPAGTTLNAPVGGYGGRPGHRRVLAALAGRRDLRPGRPLPRRRLSQPPAGPADPQTGEFSRRAPAEGAGVPGGPPGPLLGPLGPLPARRSPALIPR